MTVVVESFVLILCFAAKKKKKIKRDHVSSAVQGSDVNNTREPHEFLEFVG